MNRLMSIKWLSSMRIRWFSLDCDVIGALSNNGRVVLHSKNSSIYVSQFNDEKHSYVLSCSSYTLVSSTIPSWHYVVKQLLAMPSSTLTHLFLFLIFYFPFIRKIAKPEGRSVLTKCGIRKYSMYEFNAGTAECLQHHNHIFRWKWKIINRNSNRLSWDIYRYQ